MTKRDEDRTRAAYYGRGAAWAYETVAALHLSRASAFGVAGAAVGIALLNMVALLCLAPLRQMIPYGVTVEDQRGEPLQSEILQKGRVQDNPAYTQSMLARYVIAREEFAPAHIQRDFQFVELLSSPSLRGDYAESLAKTNGASPLVTYPPTANVNIGVVNVALLDSTHAVVRYTTTRGDLDGAQPEQGEAQVTFRYVDGAMRNIDRYDDPLGFQVTSYSKEPI